jgi:hypothetical protein
MTRVLMGDFSALHRLGLQDILRCDGIELVEAADADVVDRLVEALPDVIVLDLDQHHVLDLVYRIVYLFPSVKVVACSCASFRRCTTASPTPPISTRRCSRAPCRNSTNPDLYLRRSKANQQRG